MNRRLLEPDGISSSSESCADSSAVGGKVGDGRGDEIGEAEEDGSAEALLRIRNPGDRQRGSKISSGIMKLAGAVADRVRLFLDRCDGNGDEHLGGGLIFCEGKVFDLDSEVENMVHELCREEKEDPRKGGGVLGSEGPTTT